jgi:hypothetical protein
MAIIAEPPTSSMRCFGKGSEPPPPSLVVAQETT